MLRFSALSESETRRWTYLDGWVPPSLPQEAEYPEHDGLPYCRLRTGAKLGQDALQDERHADVSHQRHGHGAVPPLIEARARPTGADASKCLADGQV